MLNACNEPEILEILQMAKTIIRLLCIFAPIIVIIQSMIDVAKATVGKEIEDIAANIKRIIPRLVALCAIFLVPAMIEMTINIADDYSKFATCLTNANDDYIQIAYTKKANDLLDVKQEDWSNNDYGRLVVIVDKIKDKAIKDALNVRLKTYKNVLDERKKQNKNNSTQGNFGNGIGAKAMSYAITKVGSPYIWGGIGPNNFDCSGLIKWSLEQTGYKLPGGGYYRSPLNSTSNWDNVGAIITVSSLDQAVPGDMIIMYNRGHIAFYYGKDSNGNHQKLHAQGDQSCSPNDSRHAQNKCRVKIDTMGSYDLQRINRIVRIVK